MLSIQRIVKTGQAQIFFGLQPNEQEISLALAIIAYYYTREISVKIARKQ